MEKEFLTRNIIKSELKKIYLKDIIKLLIAITALYIYILILSNILNGKILYSFVFFPIESIAIAITMIFSHIKLILVCIPFIKILQDKFELTADTLAAKEEGLDDFHGKYRFRIFTWSVPFKPHTLSFNNPGKYKVMNMTYYKWSNHHIQGDHIFEFSDIGDSFIVVRIGKKIVMVYNLKYFDFQE